MNAGHMLHYQNITEAERYEALERTVSTFWKQTCLISQSIEGTRVCCPEQLERDSASSSAYRPGRKFTLMNGLPSSTSC